ncbi:MAG: PEGA domain-containing protein [Gemmatimonadaceae bacterium]|nr:PEGA domain-containing protein [Gemmatimonadaceae bacterium]
MIRRFALALAVLLSLPAAASAQGATRATLLRDATTAYENFESARALELGRAALDPALGAPDSTWARAVHLLTQLLSEGGEETLARTWARWAMRTNPGMRIDTVNFLPAVVATLRQARTDVGTRTSSDEVTRLSYQWAARTSRETQGRVRVDPSTMPVPVSVLVRGTGVLPAGNGLALAPGTYDFEVSANGYLPARVQREVLPGVTVTLSFQLTTAAVAAGTIAEPVRQQAYRSTAALNVTRFGIGVPACAAAASVGGRFLVTSYSAIRGADNLGASFAGTSAGDGIRVAAHDVSSDLAVLLLPAPRPDSLRVATTVIDGQAAWGVGLTQCRTPSDTRAVVEEWAQRPLGALRLSETIAQGVAGSPLVDYQGRLLGVFTHARAAQAAPAVTPLLEQARRNLAAQQTLTLGELARRENHAFGVVAVTADVLGATAKLTPRENWHLPTDGTTGPAPLTYSGPMGRYTLETSAPGVPAKTQDITIRPGETVRVQVMLRTAIAQTPNNTLPPAGTVKKGGVPKWVWIAVLGGGAAAAAALGGGGGGSSGGGGGGGSQTGGIIITVPNP